MSNIGIYELSSIEAKDFQKNIGRYISSSRKVRKSFIQMTDYKKAVECLSRDIYIFDMMNGFIGYKLLKTREDIWNICNQMMDEYMMEFYSDKNFFNKISKVIDFYKEKKELTDNNRNISKYLHNIYSKRIISNETHHLEDTMKMHENKIFNMLNCYPTLNISNKYIDKSVNDKELKTTIELNDYNYIELLHRIEDIMIRHRVENTYLSRTRNCLLDVAKLVLHRHKYAIKNGYPTYFQYINREKYDNTLTIKEMIHTLNKKISVRFEKEIDKIHSYYSDQYKTNHLITNCDIIRYVRNKEMTYKFMITDSMKCIFEMCKKYFNLSFVKDTKNGTIIDTELYICYDQNNRVLGRLYCDLIWKPDKNIKGVITIKISDRIYLAENNRISVPEVVLIGGLQEGCVSYKDFVSIFREMGYVLQYLCYDSKMGLLNYDDEFSNFVPMIMEYIAWNRNTAEHLLKISGNKDDHQIIIDHLELVNSISQLYSLEMRCISAKFDHILHNSIPFIEMLQKTKNEKQMETLILELYQTTHREIMEPIKSMFNIIPSDIDPITIAQQVNNTHGILYSNIMNEIFAYCAYWIICFKGVTTFREEVLADGTTAFKELVRNFIKKADINCFELFIRDVIRSNPIEDYISEDTNYFEDDGSDSDGSDSDGECIIQINRVSDRINNLNIE